jgi:Fe-S-cluster containining protein
MAWLDTPWGRVRVPGDIPVEIACARCGTCCRAFFLSVTDETLAEWRARRDRGDTAGLPPDLDAVLELFVPLAEPPRTPDGSWYTCRAFDPARNLCTLLPNHPERRPQACWAFPYIYDRQSFAEFPYPNCHIFRGVTKERR